MPTETHSIRHYLFIGLIVVAIILGAILFWPFGKVIILSAAFAFVLSPIHRFFLYRITRGNKWFAALFTTTVFLIAVCVPIILIGSSVFQQAQGIYSSFLEGSATNQIVTNANALVNRFIPWISFDLEQHLSSVAGAITSSLGSVAGFILSAIFSLLIFILALFYFLEDGPRWRRTIIKNSPLSDESMEKIITKLSQAVDGVVKGYLFIAVIQGVLLGVGLWVFGVPNPALWGLLAGIASLVPTVGTALVSIPAVIYLFSIGNTGAAVGLAIWATILVGFIDNLISPVIVGRKIDIHPMLILFAVLGGIALLGPAGILIGPLIVSFIYALTSVYASEMK